MPKKQMIDPRECAYCHKLFIPNRRWQKYCSPAHNRQAFYERQAAHPPGTDPPPLATPWYEQEYPRQSTHDVLDEAEETLRRAREVGNKSRLPSDYQTGESTRADDGAIIPKDEDILP